MRKKKCSYCGGALCPICGGCCNSGCEGYTDLCFEDLQGFTLEERQSLMKYKGKTSLSRMIDKIKKEKLSAGKKVVRKRKRIMQKKTKTEIAKELNNVLDKLPLLIDEVSTRWNIKVRVKDGRF